MKQIALTAEVIEKINARNNPKPEYRKFPLFTSPSRIKEMSDLFEVSVRPCIDCDGHIEECLPDQVPEFYGVYVKCKLPGITDNNFGMWLADFDNKLDAENFKDFLSALIKIK